jgi:hypothetical protein
VKQQRYLNKKKEVAVPKGVFLDLLCTNNAFVCSIKERWAEPTDGEEVCEPPPTLCLSKNPLGRSGFDLMVSPMFFSATSLN